MFSVFIRERNEAKKARKSSNDAWFIVLNLHIKSYAFIMAEGNDFLFCDCRKYFEKFV